MGWLALTSTEQLGPIAAASRNRPQVLFKHSTRCSVSSVAKNRMEAGLAKLSEKADVYYLDLLSYREVSSQIAERFNVHHESPQVLVIVNGNCILELSHLEITPNEVEQALLQAA